jgi:CheY-like chemotaxis protein
VRLLFVDDNEINRKVLRSMLESAGIVLAEAEDAESGLAMIEVGDYELVLMDLRMPGMDGLEAIRKIRARTDAKASLPVIVVTADNAHNIRTQVLAAGGDELLHKPVQMQALFDTIAAVLAKSSDQGMMFG